MSTLSAFWQRSTDHSLAVVEQGEGRCSSVSRLAEPANHSVKVYNVRERDTWEDTESVETNNEHLSWSDNACEFRHDVWCTVDGGPRRKAAVYAKTTGSLWAGARFDRNLALGAAAGLAAGTALGFALARRK